MVHRMVKLVSQKGWEIVVFFKRLVIKIGSGSNQEAVSDCKRKTEGGIGMYACCMHHLEEIVAVNFDSNEI